MGYITIFYQYSQVRFKNLLYSSLVPEGIKSSAQTDRQIPGLIPVDLLVAKCNLGSHAVCIPKQPK